MIDGEQLHLIEVNGLFERLHEAETQHWVPHPSLVLGRVGIVFFAERIAIELNGFGRTSNIADDFAFARRDPVSNDACAEHIADELVVRAIPGEERWTGTAAAVHFSKGLRLVGGDFDFILQNAGRPRHADDIGNFRLSEADGQVGRVLPEVAGGTVHFELLPQPSGKDFHLRADGALVIVQALERETQRVVLVTTFVVEQHSRAVILRDQKIGSAVVVVVAHDDGARLFELNLVEPSFSGDIFESVGPEIAKEANFALAVFRFADRDEIDPSVVVVVDGGDSVGAGPVRRRKVDLLKALAVVIAPQCQTRISAVRKGEIHPSVVIEIENGESDCPLGPTLRP